jgi:N-acetyl-anhydromuramyl-L-alanine amidase AmpD
MNLPPPPLRRGTFGEDVAALYAVLAEYADQVGDMVLIGLNDDEVYDVPMENAVRALQRHVRHSDPSGVYDVETARILALRAGVPIPDERTEPAPMIEPVVTTTKRP